MAVRAIRGAVQVDANDRAAILEGTTELVTEVMARNELRTDDVISVVFTATADLDAEFPALAARKIGFQDVPLLCATEIAVPGRDAAGGPAADARGDRACRGPRCSTCTCAAPPRCGWTSRSDRASAGRRRPAAGPQPASW